MIINSIKEYLWIIVILLLIAIRFHRRNMSENNSSWMNAIKLEPTVWFLFIATIDLSRNNYSGVFIDLKLAGIVFVISLVMGLINIYRTMM